MGETIKNLLAKIQEAIAVLKAFKEVKAILAKIAPEFKEQIQKIAKDIDELIVEFQVSDNTFDDKLIPALQTLSSWLKKISD